MIDDAIAAGSTPKTLAILMEDDRHSLPGKSPRRRSRFDNVKLFGELLSHASKVSLIQYTLSAAFIYLYTTGEWLRSDTSEISLIAFKLRMPLWIVAAPLVYALINLHMCRITRQMTRLLRKDKQNAATMAILAIQSVWFANPFHSIRFIAPVGYGVMIFVVPFLFNSLGIADSIYQITQHTRIENIATGLSSFLFAISIFLLVGAIENCRGQMLKAILSPPLIGAPSKIRREHLTSPYPQRDGLDNQ